MTLPTWFLSITALLTAVAHIRADYRGAAVQTYIFKPLTTGLILLVALLAPEPVSSSYQFLIVAGLLFSLAGDVFLMLPQDRFLAGLVSFLIAHLFYIAAFASEAGFLPAPLAALPLVLYGLLITGILWPHLGKMKGPATIYMLVILVMAWQAAGRWLEIGSTSALLAMVGALLFVVSDSTLALNRFRRPFPSAQAIVLGTYYAAQWLIAVSVGNL